MKKSEEFTVTLAFDASLDEYLKRNYPGYKDIKIFSKSLDARNAPKGRKPKYHYKGEVYFETLRPAPKKNEQVSSYKGDPPIIIGAGPAGLFCALALVEKGIKPILIERGEGANQRMRSIAKFWRYGELNPESNVCFGEGGAGLFSDGKLITRVKSEHIPYVMNKLVEMGAPKEIAYLSNPHLGSNKIRGLIMNIRRYLIEKGCEVRLNSKVVDILTSNKNVTGVRFEDGTTLTGDKIVLAVGHSADEMYHLLAEKEVAMSEKDFAIGVRIEHKREYINKIQFGDFAGSPDLGSATYRLSYHNKETDLGTYSFCMCPGGYVLSSGTDSDGLVVNGMSNSTRHSPWSNSALVVTTKYSSIAPEAKDLFAGLNYQRKVEMQAYQASKDEASGRELPALSLEEFMNGKVLSKKLPVTSSPSGIFKSELYDLLPKVVSDSLRTSIEQFAKKLPGYDFKNALLIAPETRTSAPLKILRDKVSLESLSHKGLYPCGEGAGYAGGITSAACDGVKVAHNIF